MTRTLIDKGVLVLVKKEKKTSLISSAPRMSIPTLTIEQRKAIKEIQESSDAIFLLHGVTGSGKTEVFTFGSICIRTGKTSSFLSA